MSKDISECPTCGSVNQPFCIAWKTGGMTQAEQPHLPNTKACEPCKDSWHSQPDASPTFTPPRYDAIAEEGFAGAEMRGPSNSHSGVSAPALSEAAEVREQPSEEK